MSDSAQRGVAEVIDGAPISRLQAIVFILCLLITALDGFATQAIAFVAPVIGKSWGLTQLDFGFIFSATLLGSVAGAILFGAISDRIGRRWLTIAMTALFGIFSVLAAFTHGFETLLLCRILAGIGLGGVIPNTSALVSEYAPMRLRSTIVTVTLWGFPGGAVLGGLLSGSVITSYGWQAVFIIGGMAPLLLVPVLVLYLPESLRFLAGKPERHGDAQRLLSRIAPGQLLAVEAQGAPRAAASRTGYGALFKSQLAATTVLLSAALFLSLLLSYLLVNWTPMILAQTGMTVSNAILGTVAINAGGIVGSYLMSRMVDRSRRPLLLLGSGYVASGIVLVVVGGNMSGSATVVLLNLGICGFFLVGSQISMTAFTAGQFPVALRGTGIGMVQSVGRLGSLVGPIAGGALLNAGLPPQRLFVFCLFPALTAAAALFLLAALRRGKPRPSPPSLRELPGASFAER